MASVPYAVQFYECDRSPIFQEKWTHRKKNGVKWVKEFFVVVPQPLNELTSNLTLVAASGSNGDAVRIRAMLNQSTVSEFVDVNVICTVPNITLIESKITLFIV